MAFSFFPLPLLPSPVNVAHFEKAILCTTCSNSTVHSTVHTIIHASTVAVLYIYCKMVSVQEYFDANKWLDEKRKFRHIASIAHQISTFFYYSYNVWYSCIYGIVWPGPMKMVLRYMVIVLSRGPDKKGEKEAKAIPLNTMYYIL